jgi:hypothetical protein
MGKTLALDLMAEEREPREVLRNTLELAAELQGAKLSTDDNYHVSVLLSLLQSSIT